MTREVPESHPLHRLFRGMTESTFMTELGIGDPRLVGYMANLLARFIPSQTIWRIRDGQGRRLTQVTAMIAEAESTTDADRRLECHRHVGDYTLFWTGVYPEVVNHLRRGSKDAFIDYPQQGKRAYWIASTIPVEREAEPSDVLKQLSEQFDLCVYGLGEVRRQWEHQQGDEDAPLLLG
jgi:hypothetical protein